MPSSFVRKGAQSNLQGPGTRPGLHGQTLVSTGLAGLDSLLGGGLPLGSVLLIIEEQRSQPQCTALLKHFLAEGAACGQALCLAAPKPPVGGVASFIPAQPRAASSSGGAEAGRAERTGGKGEEEAAAEPELKIAWQYRRYIKKKEASDAKREEAEEKAASAARRAARASSSSSSASRSSAGKEWCHRFDVQLPLGEDGLKQSGSVAAATACRGDGALASLRGAVSALVDGVAAATALGTRDPKSVGRAAIQSLGSPTWQLDSEAVGDDLLRTLYWIRGAMRDTRCCACVTLCAEGLPASLKQRACQMADTVLSVEALHDDSLLVGLSPDPATAVALLRLLSSAPIGALGTPPLGPEGEPRLLRLKRRRLVLEEIDIDPDAEQALGDVYAAPAPSVSASW